MRAATGILSLISLLVSPATLTGQDQPLVGLGSRVRVVHDCPENLVDRNVGTTRCRIDSGILAAVTVDSLALTLNPGGAPLVLGIAGVRRLYVRRRGSRSGRIRKGALTGGAVFGTLGLFLGLSGMGECGGFSVWPCEANPGEVLLVGAATGVVGAAVGSLIGMILPTRQRWERVMPDGLRVELAALAGGNFAFGASVRF